MDALDEAASGKFEPERSLTKPVNSDGCLPSSNSARISLHLVCTQAPGVQSQGLRHRQRENSSLVRAVLLGQCDILTHEDLCLLVMVPDLGEYRLSFGAF